MTENDPDEPVYRDRLDHRREAEIAKNTLRDAMRLVHAQRNDLHREQARKPTDAANVTRRQKAEERAAEARTLAKSGMPKYRIAKKIGVHRRSVDRYLEEKSDRHDA